MKFRKPQLIPVLFIIGATLLLGGLGAWQVKRLAWKEGMIAQIQQAQAEPLLTLLPADISGLSYRRVELSGRFDYDRAYHLIAAPQGDVSGFYLITPLRLFDGRSILVNRGFSPLGKESRPAGIQRVTGVLRPPRPKRFFSPANDMARNLWFYEDLSAMGNHPLPLVIEETGEQKPGVYPIPSDGKIELRNDHLSYAITWFSIMVIGLVMFVFYHRIPENKHG